jgi:hypothetical protein
MGQKQTLGKVRLMSALPQKADIGARRDHVGFAPNSGPQTGPRSEQQLWQLGDIRREAPRPAYECISELRSSTLFKQA